MRLNSTTCCGVRDFDGLTGSRTKDIIDSVSRDRFMYEENYRLGRFVVDKNTIVDNNKYRFVMFTDVSQNFKLSDNLIEFIKVNKLGKTTKVRQSTNPNSGNKLRIVIWTISDKGLKEWFKNIKV